jgi:hypothetical protein
MAGGKAGGAGKKDEPAKKTESKEKKKPTPPDWDELYEDGDVATPKRDRYGSDDEPY